MICRVGRSLINRRPLGEFDAHMAECRACREDLHEILQAYCQALIRAKPRSLSRAERQLRQIVLLKLRLARGAKQN